MHVWMDMCVCEWACVCMDTSVDGMGRCCMYMHVCVDVLYV